MAVATPTRSTNWWGLSSTLGLFAWILGWLKNEPHGILEQILCWLPLALIHFFAIQAASRRSGWFYLLPLCLFWILVIIALSGGIEY